MASVDNPDEPQDADNSVKQKEQLQIQDCKKRVNGFSLPLNTRIFMIPGMYLMNILVYVLHIHDHVIGTEFEILSMVLAGSMFLFGTVMMI